MWEHRRRLLWNRAGCKNADAILISHPTDVRWMTGFTGSNGALWITQNRSVLFTDGRYTHQASNEVKGIEVKIGAGSALKTVVDWASINAWEGSGACWIQKNHMSLTGFEMISSQITSDRLSDIARFLDHARAVKTSDELSHVQRALAISERVLSEVLPFIKEGVTENELAAEIDYRQRRLGAERSSFDTIIAFSDHSALPHARPGNRSLKMGDCILADFGCTVQGYASDMTRMLCLGKPSAQFSAHHSLIREAVILATERIASGMNGAEIDAIARNFLREHGLSDYFTHSLGHGVGLDIHEWPSISSKNEDVVPDGSVFTIEPGIYFPDQYGIRIENMVFLSDGKARTLNQSLTELLVL